MSLASHLEALEPVLAASWRIFPCATRAKEPLLKDWPRRASCDADVISRWAEKHANCNWGLACGPDSGVFVLDVDGERGENSLRSLVEQHGIWERTLTAITARGRHFYFDWPSSGTIRNSTGKIGDGLDVRGYHGYTIIPPSVHPLGAPYEWESTLNEHAPASAPAWLLETVTSAVRPAIKASEIGILLEGQRNDRLASYAGALRRRGKNQSEIEAELFAANVRRCRPPLLDDEVRKIAASISRYAPGGLDPLESAWQAIQGETYASSYERFIALAWRLQQARPDQTIALPLERISGLMNVHWTTISRYRKTAVAAGVLQPFGQYIPHRVAGVYRVSSGEKLTKMLTSGLVSICQKPLVSIPENSPSEHSPLVSTLESASPLVSTPPEWKTPTFTVLSQEELAEKVARSKQTAARWNEIAGRVQ